MIIFVLLTMPSVTDCDSASGLPIASTGWPARSLDESPNFAAGNVRGLSGCSLTTAMSDSGSVPTRSAGTSSHVDNVQTILRGRPATWWFVTT